MRWLYQVIEAMVWIYVAVVLMLAHAGATGCAYVVNRLVR